MEVPTSKAGNNCSVKKDSGRCDLYAYQENLALVTQRVDAEIFLGVGAITMHVSTPKCVQMSEDSYRKNIVQNCPGGGGCGVVGAPLAARALGSATVTAVF